MKEGDTFGIVLGSIDGRSRDKRVGAGLDQLVRVGRGDAAINLDPGVDSLLVAQLSQTPRLGHLGLDELLPSKACARGPT